MKYKYAVQLASCFVNCKSISYQNKNLMLIKIILYNDIIFLQFYFKLTGHLEYFFDKGSNDKTTF